MSILEKALKDKKQLNFMKGKMVNIIHVNWHPIEKLITCFDSIHTISTNDYTLSKTYSPQLVSNVGIFIPADITHFYSLTDFLPLQKKLYEEEKFEEEPTHPVGDFSFGQLDLKYMPNI